MATYSNRFVLCALVNGRPVKARPDNTVPIPFGSEYTLRCKNRHKRRALVKLFVDGENVSGGGYVIDENSHIDIRRHHDRDETFKFVSLDSAEAVLEGKSDNTDGDKGVVEARFYLEREHVSVPQPYPVPYPYPYPVPIPRPRPWRPRPWDEWNDFRPYDVTWTGPRSDNKYEGIIGGVNNSVLSSFSAGEAQNMMSSGQETMLRASPPSRRQLEEGCTVPGGASGQRFTPVAFEAETDYVSIKIVLRGYRVEAATVTEDAGPETHCTGCGRKRARKSDRFCGGCGQKFPRQVNLNL